MAEKVSRRGISRYACMLLALCMLTGFGLVGTVSACGGEDPVSSSVLFGNWAQVAEWLLQSKVSNPTTCVTRVIIKVPEDPASKTELKGANYIQFVFKKLIAGKYPKDIEDQIIHGLCKGMNKADQDALNRLNGFFQPECMFFQSRGEYIK